MRGEFLQGARYGLALLAVAALPLLAPSAASAQENGEIVRNDLLLVRQGALDPIIAYSMAAQRGAPRAFGFSSEGENQFDPSNPFADNSPYSPFNALAYAKSPLYTKAPPVAPAPTYIYGVNVIGAFDTSNTAGVVTNSGSGTGAFDITKIGIFSASDALTFIGTGTGIGSHAPGLNTSTGAAAGTIAYTNGGFSTDFTGSPNWSRATATGFAAPATNVSSMTYLANAQYRFAIGSAYIEPTVGVTYTDLYANSFGAHTGSNTQVDGGARFGWETVVDKITLQPSITATAFSLVAQTGAGAPAGVPGAVAAGTPTGSVGARASAKLNVIWNKSFSSFIEAHGMTIAGTNAAGASGGLRWTF